MATVGRLLEELGLTPGDIVRRTGVSYEALARLVGGQRVKRKTAIRVLGAINQERRRQGMEPLTLSDLDNITVV
jgi:predicted transcriptional regulator